MREKNHANQTSCHVQLPASVIAKKSTGRISAERRVKLKLEEAAETGV